MTWRCNICGKERPDEKISVLVKDISAEYNLPPVTILENTKYCNDNEDCINKAHDFSIIKKKDKIQVCDKCLMASCWQGIFMCDESNTAGTAYKTKAELAELALEHPCYWKTDEELTNKQGDIMCVVLNRLKAIEQKIEASLRPAFTEEYVSGQVKKLYEKGDPAIKRLVHSMVYEVITKFVARACLAAAGIFEEKSLDEWGCKVTYDAGKRFYGFGDDIGRVLVEAKFSIFGEQDIKELLAEIQDIRKQIKKMEAK